jgi:hypothetical protein
MVGGEFQLTPELNAALLLLVNLPVDEFEHFQQRLKQLRMRPSSRENT